MTGFVLIFISNTIDEYNRTDKEQPMQCICNVFNKFGQATLQESSQQLYSKGPSDCTVNMQAIVQSIKISYMEKMNIFGFLLGQWL